MLYEMSDTPIMVGFLKEAIIVKNSFSRNGKNVKRIKSNILLTKIEQNIKQFCIYHVYRIHSDN